MKENEKINELSDEQLDDVSGGLWNINDLFPNNMGNIPQQNVVNNRNWMDNPINNDPWIVIEAGYGKDEDGEYTYQISYNKITGEKHEERSYYLDNY